MKRLFSRALVLLVAAVLLFACGCNEAEKEYPDYTDNIYINDFSGVVDKDDADEISNLGAALDKATAKALGADTGAQVAAVTVADTGDEDISEYALALGRKWGVGNKKENNGVLILLATEDREIYVAVGYGLEGALPDSKTGRLIDNYAIDYLRENEFSSGLLNLYRAIVREVYGEYNLDVPENTAVPQEYGADIDILEARIAWIVIAVAVMLWLFLLRRRGLSTAFFGGFGGFGGSGGFGGFGSGGSGGFGGFGGGSFGGGGAGRGF